MNIDLTDEETAVLLRKLDDRYFLSPRVQTLKTIRNKIRPAPPLKAPPPLKQYEPPRVARRRRG